MSEYPAYFALGWFLLQEFDPVGGGVEVAGGGVEKVTEALALGQTAKVKINTRSLLQNNCKGCGAMLLSADFDIV